MYLTKIYRPFDNMIIQLVSLRLCAAIYQLFYDPHASYQNLGIKFKRVCFLNLHVSRTKINLVS